MGGRVKERADNCLLALASPLDQYAAMRIYGLTGGIASGKSTVSGMLRELGATILDADATYARIIEPVEGHPSPLGRRISDAFGDVMTDAGGVDRAKLAARVFNDDNALRLLNTITHPAVAQAFGRQLEQLAGEGVRTVIYDVPLLYESKLEAGMLGVIVVWLPAELQRARLMQRNGLAREEAEKRLQSQLPLDEKRARADWVIDNSGTREETYAQVEEIWRIIREPLAKS